MQEISFYMQKEKENTVFYDVLASRAQQKIAKNGSKTDQNRFPKASYDFTSVHKAVAEVSTIGNL